MAGLPFSSEQLSSAAFTTMLPTAEAGGARIFAGGGPSRREIVVLFLALEKKQKCDLYRSNADPHF